MFAPQIVSGALNGLGGPLAGKYYPLKSMTDKEQEQLIEVQSYLLCIHVVHPLVLATPSVFYTCYCINGLIFP